MVVEQKYDFSSKKLDFGFSYKTEKINNPLNGLIDSVKENIIICDTQGIAIDKFLAEAGTLLNSTKTVIGLVNDKTLADLKKKGVKNGFFRSTKTKINVAVLIIDKKNHFVSSNGEVWLELKDEKAYAEIFQYINHLIWTNTLSEFIQGEYNDVKESRLSVVMPVFANAASKPEEANLGTEDINALELLVSTEKHYNKKAHLMVSSIPSAYVIKDTLYINLFDDKYYAVSKFNDLFKGESFSDASYSSFVNNQIWFNNKLITVSESDVVVKTTELPVDELKNFKPDFDSEAKKYSGYTTNLTIRFDVTPMKKNANYHKHANYKNYTDLENMLNVNLEKLIKLAGDEKKLLKQLDAISSSRTIAEKVEKYNKYITETKIGEDTLISKKNGFKEIKYKESDVIIPSELLGELLTKDKKTFFALASEDKLEDAIKWLKDNKLEAVFILG